MIKKPLSVVLGAAFAVSGMAAQASVFQTTDLGTGYMVASAAEGKCGEGKCGAGKKDEKAHEGKCGEAKKDDKAHEGKCGEKKDEKAH
jgi:uncharacterized low-complexity protein